MIFKFINKQSSLRHSSGLISLWEEPAGVTQGNETSSGPHSRLRVEIISEAEMFENHRPGVSHDPAATPWPRGSHRVVLLFAFP